MNIESVRLFQYDLPLRGGLKMKGSAVGGRAGILVQLRAGEIEGWGDVAPLPGFSIESVDDAAEYLRENALRFVGVEVDGELPPSDRLAQAFEDAPPSARFGMELAWFSLVAAQRREPLRRLLRPDAGDRVSINGLLAGTPEQIMESAAHAKESGLRCAKLKVGRESPEKDLELVRAVKNALGADVQLRLDANRQWTVADATAFARKLDVEIEYLEEPLKNPAQLPTLASACSVPVGLDETLCDTPWEIWTEFPQLRAVVIKPTLLGGIARARKVAALAAGRGLNCVISSSFESGVGYQGLCELAAAFSGSETAAGLDTYRWLEEDVLLERPDPAARLTAVPATPSESRLNRALLRELPNG